MRLRARLWLGLACLCAALGLTISTALAAVAPGPLGNEDGAAGDDAVTADPAG